MKSIREKRGFTLIEMMIVVGIIALLASLLIPNVLRSRVAANESNAINLLITLRNASISYFSSHTPNTFPETLEDLTTPVSNPFFVHPTIIGSIKNQRVSRGYYFVYSKLPNNRGFTIIARPGEYRRSGERSFLSDAQNRIFVTSEDREPNPLTDPELQ